MFLSLEMVWISKSARSYSFWANRGFSNYLSDDNGNLQASNRDYEHIIAALDECFDELRNFSIRQAVNKGFGNGSCSVEWEKSPA